ncbi:MAG: ECF transporter S component [Clostridia bacterium]|nr:ECF transporter S component [Clostridia bacterium]
MRNQKVKTVVTTSLFAAIVCVTTMVIQIPSPMNGYVNMGDCFCLLSGWLLGPVYGVAAAAIGSGLADILTGYAYYAPATVIIKGLVALLAYAVFALMFKLCKGKGVIARIVSGVAAELVMVLGYFVYAWLILGEGLAAAASIPGNLVQGLFGIIAACLIIQIIRSTKPLRDFFER